MDGPVEPPAQRQGGNGSHSRKQLVLSSKNATPSRRSVVRRLGGFCKAAAGAGASYVRGLLSRATSARALSIAAITLAGIAVFMGPIGLPGSSAGRLDENERAVKRIEMRLAAAGLSRTHIANPTTLLVAVQFVTAAAERSAPFDTALAVAISMIGEHPKIGPLLDELLAEAGTGVPSLDELRAEFQARFAEAEKNGLLGDASGASGRSSFRLSRLWGWGDSEIDAAYRATLQKLTADVANRHLAQAVQLVAKLDGRLRDALEVWREKAQRRVAVDAALAELRRATFIDLIGDES
jgi:hypothetical protein